MSCNPSRILLSNSGTTTMLVTVEPTPDPEVDVTFQVDELGINETATTSAGVATFSIGVVTASNNSLWDATIQIGANMRAAATAQAVETNGATSIGVTVSSGQVTYCAPTGGGTGTGTVTGVTGVSPISVTASTVSPEVSLEDVSPTSAGAFTNADITVDDKGRVIVAATGSTQASSLVGPVLFDAKNDTGVTITKGSVVYIDGVSGNTPTVALADANDAAKMPAFGLAYADLADAATGSIITFGDITNVDTDGFVLDNPLYVSTTPGVLTQTKPAGETSLIQNIGLVTRVQQSSGRIKVTGAGRSNDTPNLDDGNIFIGNASNQVTTAALSTLTGVTSIIAGSNVTVDQPTGAVTISSTAGGTGTVTSVATGTGLTGGPITTTGTITHQAQPVSGTGPAFVKSVEIDALGHVSSVVGESTAGAYRTATGTDDADNLISGTVALARLPALAAAYTGQIETIADKTYTIDPGVVAGRTITSFYARSGAGTCTATLKNAALTVGVVSVTTSSTNATISNTTVAVDSALTIVVTSNISATDVVFSVEFTQ